MGARIGRTVSGSSPRVFPAGPEARFPSLRVSCQSMQPVTNVAVICLRLWQNPPQLLVFEESDRWSNAMGLLAI
jgi:hypothetical protein